MVQTTSQFNSVLLVQDRAGDYRPAQAHEVLQVAQRLLKEQIRERTVFCAPQLVRDFVNPGKSLGHADTKPHHTGNN